MTEPTPPQPVPPRFRQLKRWTLRAAVLLALLAGLRAWWGYEAQRRVDAFVAESHALGRKVLPGDFARADAVPAELNAALLLDGAARGIVLTPQQRLWETNFTMTLPLTAADRTNLAAITAANRPSLDAARKARSLPHVDWGVAAGWQAYPTALPKLAEQRQLATLLAYAALAAHDAGNDADAVALLLDLDAQVSAVRQVAPYIVTMLTADGYAALLSEQALRIAPRMDVTGLSKRAATTTPTTRPAAREQVRELIERLLDDRADHRAAADAWDGEAMLTLEMTATLARQIDPPVLAPLLRPMHTLDSVRAARARTAHRAAATRPTLPAAVAALPPRGLRGRKSHLHEWVTIVSQMGRDVPTAHEHHFRVLTDRRAAALMLAIRLYGLEHDGAIPPALDALVPACISRVPVDPMSRAAQPMKYRGNPHGVLIYSVGLDGNDDGGAAVWGMDPWAGRDTLYLMSRTPPAATRPGS